MKTRTVLMVLFFPALAAAVGFGLWREVAREQQELESSLSGVVDVSPALAASGAADIVRTDRLVLLLVDPATRQPVAIKFLSPLTPPQTFLIGARDALGESLPAGELLLVGISDKDGEIFRITPGEVYGRMPGPLLLGTEQVRLTLDQPFRGTLFNDPFVGQQGPDGEPPASVNPAHAIAGVIRVAPELSGRVRETDRLVILLFDPATGRPVASNILPNFRPPQEFRIAVTPQAVAQGKTEFFLRVVTDRDNNPVHAVAGELVGRAASPIPLGSQQVDFVLNQPYLR